MNLQKVISLVLLVFFSIYSVSCTTTKFVNPNSPPPEIKSEKIRVYTKDNQEHIFTQVRVVNDTLFGVHGIAFPEDRYGSQVVIIPVSNVSSLQYVGSDKVATALLIAVGVLVLIGVAAAIIVGQIGGVGLTPDPSGR